MSPSPCFEFKIAVIGGKSSAKNEALNSLFGDKFVPEEWFLNQATVVAFRIISNRRDDDYGDNDDDIINVRPAASTRAEIIDMNTSKNVRGYVEQGGIGNKKLSHHEIFYDIQTYNSLDRKLRDDVSFVFVNIPAIHESKKHELGERYLTKNWETFDRAIIIVDPLEEAESEYMHILQIIKQLMKKKKPMPVIILCNHNEDYNQSVALQRLRKEISSFNECTEIPRITLGTPIKIDILSYDSDDDDLFTPSKSVAPAKGKFDEEIATATTLDYFVSASIKTAFIIQMAAQSRLTLESIQSVDIKVLEEIGLAILNANEWERLAEKEEKSMAVFKILCDVEKSKKLYASTNFDSFVRTVQELVGDFDDQARLLMDQKTKALEKLEPGTPFTHKLRSICEKYNSFGENPSSTFVKYFWKNYKKCEDCAFAKFEREINPSRLALPLDQLSLYADWVEEQKLYSERNKVEEALKSLVRRQLHMVIHKISLWSFDEWYSKMNGHEWKKLATQAWDQLSPSDWSTIISSLLLASCDSQFYESFGREKIALERFRFLSNKRLIKSDNSLSNPSNKFSAADGCPSLEHSLDGSYDKGRFRPKYPQTFDCVVQFDVPDSLSSKAHWAYIAWKYCALVRSLRERESHKEVP